MARDVNSVIQLFLTFGNKIVDRMLGQIFGSPQIRNAIPRFQLFWARGGFMANIAKNGPREFTFTKTNSKRP